MGEDTDQSRCALSINGRLVVLSAPLYGTVRCGTVMLERTETNRTCVDRRSESRFQGAPDRRRDKVLTLVDDLADDAWCRCCSNFDPA